MRPRLHSAPELRLRAVGRSADLLHGEDGRLPYCPAKFRPFNLSARGER